VGMTDLAHLRRSAMLGRAVVEDSVVEDGDRVGLTAHLPRTHTYVLVDVSNAPAVLVKVVRRLADRALEALAPSASLPGPGDFFCQLAVLQARPELLLVEDPSHLVLRDRLPEVRHALA
jgi:hypothetical protein